jgi:hypothetical protein
MAVYEKDLPISIDPLLKLTPSSEVTVCAIGSLFVQVTVLPTLTVVDAGKAIPEIEMLFGLLLLPVLPAGDVLDFEQESIASDSAAAKKIAKYFVFMI